MFVLLENERLRSSHQNPIKILPINTFKRRREAGSDGEKLLRNDCCNVSAPGITASKVFKQFCLMSFVYQLKVHQFSDPVLLLAVDLMRLPWKFSTLGFDNNIDWDNVEDDIERGSQFRVFVL
ncbi:hypothetical protein Q3G72_010014 [Acer saccharum]|nr:hypothetical protein Q3G72_010014 [Acer saccharum]